MDEIVERNLQKMQGQNKGGMVNLILNESWGGTAGKFNGLPCTGANFRYDKSNGEIIYFGNYQDVPEEIRDHYAAGIFRITSDGKLKNVRIIECDLSSDTSSKAEQILKETMKQYNEAKNQL